MNDFLGSPQFQDDLRAASQWAFRRYGARQSKYDNAEDLQQDVIARFIRWIPRYRGDASLKTVLSTIASNLLLDAARQHTTREQQLRRIEWDEFDLDSLRGSSGTEHEFRVLFKECLARLSDVERHVFIESRLQRKSIRQIAEELRSTPAVVTTALKKAISKLRDCVS